MTFRASAQKLAFLFMLCYLEELKGNSNAIVFSRLEKLLLKITVLVKG